MRTAHHEVNGTVSSEINHSPHHLPAISSPMWPPSLPCPLFMMLSPYSFCLTRRHLFLQHPFHGVLPGKEGGGPKPSRDDTELFTGPVHISRSGRRERCGRRGVQTWGHPTAPQRPPCSLQNHIPQHLHPNPTPGFTLTLRKLIAIMCNVFWEHGLLQMLR